MARLFLIRHGEPEAAWGGAVDDPGLSEQGRAQAEVAAEALVKERVMTALSSPMRRCQETAAPYLARTGMALEIDPGFGEVMTPGDVKDRRAWLAENFPWRAGAGVRDWTAVDGALRQWRADVVRRACEVRVDTAVFTHFIASNAIVGAAMDRPQTIVFRPDYASITELEVLNGALYLRGLGAEMRDGEVR